MTCLSEVLIFTFKYVFLVDEMMITLLDAGQRETVFFACGLLMNFMKDSENRRKLLIDGGVKR